MRGSDYAFAAIISLLASSLYGGEAQLRFYLPGDGSQALSMDLTGPREIHIIPAHKKMIVYSFSKGSGPAASWNRVRQETITIRPESRVTITADVLSFQIVSSSANPGSGFEISDAELAFDARSSELTVKGKGKEDADEKISKRLNLKNYYIILSLPSPRLVQVRKAERTWSFLISGVYPGSQVEADFMEIAQKYGLPALELAMQKEPGGDSETCFSGMTVPISHAQKIASELERKGYQLKSVK